MNILLLIVLILLGLLIFKTVFCDSFLGDSFLGDRSRGDGSVSARNSWVARKYDLPKEWSWARISMNEASIFEKLTNTKIQPGNYTSPVINQHRSGWCGCCYLIAVIQMIEDRWNIEIGKRYKNQMHPFVKLDHQKMLDEYNYLRRKSQPAWNACQGGDPRKVIACIESGACKIHISPRNGSSWVGHPQMKSDGPTFTDAKTTEFETIENKSDVVKDNITKYGTVVLGIDAQCLIGVDKHGVANDSIQIERNHAVTVIGWTKCPNNKKECWIVRNSWGTDRVPANLPSNMHCVDTQKNNCTEDTKPWIGNKKIPGMVLVPIDYIENKAIGCKESSPWYQCGVNF